MNTLSVLSTMLPSDHGKMERTKMFSSLEHEFSNCGISDIECFFGLDVHFLQISFYYYIKSTTGNIIIFQELNSTVPYIIFPVFH
jgi:hypothetical protein